MSDVVGMYGDFSSSNSNDFTEIFRRCFIDCQPGSGPDDDIEIGDIAEIKQDKIEELSKLLDDIDEFSYLILEEVL